MINNPVIKFFVIHELLILLKSASKYIFFLRKHDQAKYVANPATSYNCFTPM